MTAFSTRRDFLATSALGVAGLAANLSRGPLSFAADKDSAAAPLFKISVAEWSLHKTIFGGKLNHLDFAKTAKESFGIDAVEYVNQFFRDKAKDEKYLAEMKKRCDDLGVRSLLIMIDGEGKLGDADDKKRTQAVENHYKWLEAAKFLGCHSIRVNAASDGSYDEQLGRAADGLRRLSEFGAKLGLNVIVENHGGLSSNGKWLAAVMKQVNLPNCGTLPDFGNFHSYDRYMGVTETMPFAKAVSAKSHDFDADGNETKTDYLKMMKIVLDAGYRGYVGIEYEGSKLDEMAGIRATQKLLERCQKELKV
jgi:sugar phosphate isomerase/epimerase